MRFFSKFCLAFCWLLGGWPALQAADYFVHPRFGNDSFAGTSREAAFRTLERAERVRFQPGDRLLLAAGETFIGSLRLIGVQGSTEQPIIITTVDWEDLDIAGPALIDFKSEPNGILLEGCSHIEITHLRLTGNGYRGPAAAPGNMRCGVLITQQAQNPVADIVLRDLRIFDVFFENEGFARGAEEVRTANGTQRYGWGIRVISRRPGALMTGIRIEDCVVENVSHTGIKLTGQGQDLRDVVITGNEVRYTGGPGIQMSEVRDVHVLRNTVRYSGSEDDSRKWGRGSGLWTWGSSRVLIEHNAFLHANGPGDSAGAHIDFNCDHIILQYNLSAYNAGGFVEVLGNTYRCAYRYNVSINDGHRVKGVDGAFQEGKVLWLSGYQGRQRARKGPVNFYCYNNTIFTDSTIVAKIAIDNTSQGVLIANNIFYLRGGARVVLGDQYRPDTDDTEMVEDLIFRNNLFYDADSWPGDYAIQDTAPRFGDPLFVNGGGERIEDYIPLNKDLVLNRGLEIELLPQDSVGPWQPLHLMQDILGRPIDERPSLGAIMPE